MKKGDLIIVLTVLFAALSITLSFSLFGTRGNTVIIRQNNVVTNTLPLNKNTIVELETNTIVIKDGKVTVSRASCENQICRKHTAIFKKGETIVCLPNKVVVSIED